MCIKGAVMKEMISIVFLFIAIMLKSITVPYSTVLIKTDSNHMSGMERISPPDKQQIPLQTDCWLWHDGRNLYAYWECQIDSTFIPGAYATRDDNQTSDYIRLQLKTIRTEDFAYYFSAFPRGTCFDAVRGDNLNIDKAWNSLYDCESSFSGNLWTCRMTIPFRDLRFDGEPPYDWSFSIARQIQNTVSSYANPYTPLVNTTVRKYYDSFESLIINEQIDLPRNYYVIPYFYKSYDMLTEEKTFDPKHLGVNIIYRPTSNSSMKLAFNPDFTEAPVDAEIDEHNSKYPPYIQENRIFFTEDLNAFGVNENQFYSRNIMQPQYAVKFTASGRNWNMGVLTAQDKETKQDSTVINPADNYTLLAYKPRFGRFANQFTVLGRTNQETEKYNYLFYSAPSYQVNPQWQLDAWYIQSYDKVKGYDSRNGHLAFLSSNQVIGNFTSQVSVREVTKYYIPRMGTPQARYDVNLFNSVYFMSYDNNYPGKFIRTFHSQSTGDVTWEHEGNHEVRSKDLQWTSTVNFLPRFYTTFTGNIGEERQFNDKLIPWRNLDINIGTDHWLTCSGYAGMGIGDAVVYHLIDLQHSYRNQYFYAGINGFLGPVISYIFSDNHFIWKEMPKPEEFIIGAKGDNEYDVTNLDTELTFSKDLKLVLGVRYNNYDAQGYQQHVGYFCTMHWFLNSSTKIYMGYNATEDDYMETMYKTSETMWFKTTKTF